MSIQGISSESSKIQTADEISKRVQEKKVSDDAREVQAQKAAEQKKAETAKALSPSPDGVGETVNRRA
jgi:hypothetical protein